MRTRPLHALSDAGSPALLGLFVAAHVGLKGVFFSRPFLHGVALPLEAATHGLITPVLLAGLVSWAVLLGGVMVGAGRLRPSAVGLDRRRLADAWPVLLGLWLLVQVAALTLGASSGRLALDPALGFGGLASQVGIRLQAVFGSGLLEEVLYRGFLQAQLFLLLRPRLGRERALLGAIVLSAVYFGVNHVPAASRMGLDPLEAAGYVAHCALVGSMLGVLYLRTGNLFVPAAAHALLNDPLPLFASPLDPALVVLVSVCALMLAWPSLSRRFGGVFTLGELEGRPAI